MPGDSGLWVQSGPGNTFSHQCSYEELDMVNLIQLLPGLHYPASTSIFAGQVLRKLGAPLSGLICHDDENKAGTD